MFGALGSPVPCFGNAVDRQVYFLWMGGIMYHTCYYILDRMSFYIDPLDRLDQPTRSHSGLDHRQATIRPVKPIRPCLGYTSGFV